MINLVFRPLAAPKPRARKQSQFKASWSKTLDLLEYELGLLGAKDIVVQAGFRLDQIRNDGWPRGGQTAEHPAVVLSFRDRKGNPLSFPCDTYYSYEDNLRAIGLSLEALRAVNRYGVTKGHEQYQGFAQIAAPADPKHWTVEAAADWLGERSDAFPATILHDPEVYRDNYRFVAKKVHPDVVGEAGRTEWDRLQNAKRLLDAHHAAKATAGV